MNSIYVCSPLYTPRDRQKDVSWSLYGWKRVRQHFPTLDTHSIVKVISKLVVDPLTSPITSLTVTLSRTSTKWSKIKVLSCKFVTWYIIVYFHFYSYQSLWVDGDGVCSYLSRLMKRIARCFPFFFTFDSLWLLRSRVWM